MFDDSEHLDSSRTAIARIAQSTIPGERADFAVHNLPESISLRERAEILRRHWFIMAGVGILAMAVAAYNMSRSTPEFRAASTIRFKDQRSSLTAGVGSPAVQNYWAVDPVKSQLELLTSRATTEGAVTNGKLQLRELGSNGSIDWITDVNARRVAATDTMHMKFTDSTYTVQFGSTVTAPYGTPANVGSMSVTVASHPEGDSASFEVTPFEVVVAGLQGGLKANRRTDTDITDLMFEDADPRFAQRVAVAATLSLQALDTHSSQDNARARREFLDQQLHKADSTLEVQSARLSAFRSASEAFSAKDKIASEQASLSALRVRREGLEADRQVLTTLVAKTQKAMAAGQSSGFKNLFSAPGLASNPVISQLYTRLLQLQMTRDSLTTGPSGSSGTNPDVIGINNLIKATGEQFIDAVKSEIETLDERINALRGMGDRSAAEISTLPRTEAEESRLIREAEGTEKLVDQLREEQQRARISEVADVGNVEIVDLARLPVAPVNAPKPRTLVFAALLGLVLGGALTLAIDGLNMSLRRLGDVERILKLPTLGSIPQLANGHSSGTVPRLKRALPAVSRTADGASRSNPTIDAEAPAFESFRSVRTSLMFSHAVQNLKSIAVTSAAEGDGKSTTTANLAAAFAQQGLRALIVDCDLRRGKLHKFFGVERCPGITEVAVGQATMEHAVRPTQISNLFVLSTGKLPPNPSELLGSQSIRQILTQAMSEYDVVIIDTPPVLAGADAAVIASIVDGVILVVRMGDTDRRAAKRALERLHVVGARVLGTVLNDPKELLSEEEYSYYYRYREKAAAV